MSTQPPELHEGIGSTPIPDPTLLTTAALTREIAALKELMVTRLDAMDKAQELFEQNLTRVPTEVDKQISHVKDLELAQRGAFLTELNALREITTTRLQTLTTRFDGMDKAITLLQHRDDKLPNVIDEKIQSLHDLHDEKFTSIEKQFRERDVRTEQSGKDSKTAVDAALQAAKEAVGEQNKSSALAIAKSEASTTKQIDGLATQIQASNTAVNDKFGDLKDRMTRFEGSGEGKSSSGHFVATVIAIVVSVAGVSVALISILLRK